MLYIFLHLNTKRKPHHKKMFWFIILNLIFSEWVYFDKRTLNDNLDIRYLAQISKRSSIPINLHQCQRDSSTPAEIGVRSTSEIHIFAPTIFFRETRCEYGVLPQSSQRRRRGRRDVVSPDCRRWPLAGKSEALSSLEADVMKHLKFYSTYCVNHEI